MPRPPNSHRHLTIGTYNVRTLNDTDSSTTTHTTNRKRFEIDAGCNKYSIDILAVQEHRQRMTAELDHLQEANGKFILASASDRGVGGVGLYLSNRIAKFQCSCQKVSDRILVAAFEGNPTLNVIAAYAPTNLAETGIKDAFFDQLRKTIDSFPPHDLVVVAGDLNARIGHQPTSRMVGPFVYHNSNNDNGDKLLHLCEATCMYIVQSRFPQPTGRLWTWMKPGKNLFTAQLDHILIRSKWINSARNCRAYNTVGVSSDHRILCARIDVSLRASVREPKKPVRFETSRLTDLDIQRNFERALAVKYSPLLANEHLLPQERYDGLLQAVTEAADETIGRKQRAPNSAPVSQETVKLIERKEQAQNDYITAPKGSDRSERKREWKTREKEAEAASVVDQQNNLANTLEEMQAAADQNQTAKVWKLLRRVSGQDARKPILVKSKHGHTSEAKLLQ